MSQRVIFITGANGGLGVSVTRKFLATGAIVIGASQKISKEDFPDANFFPCPADLTNAKVVNGAIDSVVQKFGALHAVIHLLGGFAGGKSIAETDDRTWEQMSDLNLNSAFYVLRSAIPHLRKAGNGRFVAVGSLAAVDPHAGIGAYVTFKTALAMLIRTVALENKDAGVTANVVLPGTMDTPTNRESMPRANFSKWVKTSDVADLIAWLADEGAGHVTGATLAIDGTAG
ncbi:MAG TPA: SDR family NAD(P)-dependent oxidoreductase [Candidatus Acidoferrales bacterium]